MTSLRTAAVELAGRNWLVVQLLKREIDVAIPVVDRGVDVIAFREVGLHGIKAQPLQLKCAAADSFSLDRKYADRGVPLVYIWRVFDQPVAYILTYDEALEVLGEQSRSSASWMEGGKYSATSVGARLKDGLAPFEGRWDWLENRLSQQPVSG